MKKEKSMATVTFINQEGNLETKEYETPKLISVPVTYRNTETGETTSKSFSVYDRSKLPEVGSKFDSLTRTAPGAFKFNCELSELEVVSVG